MLNWFATSSPLFLPVKEASQGTCLKTSLISALSLADSTSLSLFLSVSLATGQLLKPFQLLCFLTTKTKYESHFLWGYLSLWELYRWLDIRRRGNGAFHHSMRYPVGLHTYHNGWFTGQHYSCENIRHYQRDAKCTKHFHLQSGRGRYFAFGHLCTSGRIQVFLWGVDFWNGGL